MIKKLLKKLVPKTVIDVRRHIQEKRVERARKELFRDMFLEGRAKRTPNPFTKVVLILPSDPHTIFASLGDDAMLTSVISQARKRNPDVRFVVVTSGAAATAMVQKQGHIAAQIWDGDNFSKKIEKVLFMHGVDAAIVVGADVMDGSYDEYQSLKMLAVVNIAAKMGIPAAIMGFSVSKEPSPLVAKAFDKIDPSVTINVRDTVSMERFNKLTNSRAVLVADSAFCLQPDQSVLDFDAWYDAQKTAGKLVIGINLHPMLFKHEAEQHNSVKNLSSVLTTLAKTRDVSYVLIPHDSRPLIGDKVSLEPIRDNLVKQNIAEVYFFETQVSTTLKAVSGKLDAVLTGRMHLSIAALGMGVPVFCFSYAAKFAGLLKHFSLPLWLAPEATILLDEDMLLAEISKFVDQHEALREIVISAWPAVKKASERNYEIFDGAKSD
jgi:polysaccharide pyruvyl transferase WcaK-like protein